MKSKKTQSEKVLEYQSTNERLRKDKTQLEDEQNELKKKIEMMEQLSKSAAMVLNRNEFEDMEGNNNNLGGELGELRDFEDMENAGAGLNDFHDGSMYEDGINSNIQSRKQSMRSNNNRRATFMVDLN